MDPKFQRSASEYKIIKSTGQSFLIYCSKHAISTLSVFYFSDIIQVKRKKLISQTN